MIRRADLWLMALVVAFVAWAGHEVGYKRHLHPILERTAGVRAQTARIRSERQWFRSLRAQIARTRLKLRAVAPLLESLQAHLVRDEGERFRLAITRDLVARGVEGLALVSADPPAPAVRQAFRKPVDPNEQLGRLRQEFLRVHPQAVVQRWAVAGTIDTIRYHDRFDVEATVTALVRFLGRIEAQPPLMQVTYLGLSAAGGASGSGPRVRATIEVAGLGLPWEEGPLLVPE